MTFTPKLCPCGCGRWIMAPLFGCQCSSLTTEQKDELVAMARDALAFRALRPNRRVIDMTGRRYGRLVVIQQEPCRVRNRQNIYRWQVKCDCGTSTIVEGADLRSGKTKSCGCLSTENLAKHREKANRRRQEEAALRRNGV